MSRQFHQLQNKVQATDLNRLPTGADLIPGQSSPILANLVSSHISVMNFHPAQPVLMQEPEESIQSPRHIEIAELQDARFAEQPQMQIPDAPARQRGQLKRGSSV